VNDFYPSNNSFLCTHADNHKCNCWATPDNFHSKTAVTTISNQRNVHPRVLFKNTHLSETDINKNLGLLFHQFLLACSHSPPSSESHNPSRLRSFSNYLSHHTLLTSDKTNRLPIFYQGSITSDNCSDGDKHLLDKAQLSAAKITLGCIN